MIAPPAMPAVPPGAALVTLTGDTSPARLGPGARPLWPGARVLAVPVRRGRLDLARLARLPGVTSVEPNRVRRNTATGVEAATATAAATVDQPYLAAIGWTPPPPAGRRPLVAVLDTGVAPVPSLRGAIDTARAASFVRGRAPLADPDGHGTCAAGLIAADPREGGGIAGVAAARILPVTVAQTRGSEAVATTASLVQGIHYALAHRARVISISFAGRGYSTLEQSAVDDAARAGVLVVAAAGNDGPGTRLEYPAAYLHVLAVGATGTDGLPLPVSTAGPQVAIAAPGQDVLCPGTGLEGTGTAVRMTGTSVAAPLVSGAAARLLARTPGLTASQLHGLLVKGARAVPLPGPDPRTGAGLLDLAASLAARPPRPDAAEPDDDPSQAALLPPLVAPGARTGVLAGTVTAWSDPRDLRLLPMRAGERARLSLSGPAGVDLDLLVWRPGTPAAAVAGTRAGMWVVAAGLGPTSRERVTFTAPRAGRYPVEVRLVSGTGGRYRLVARRLGPGQPARVGSRPG